MRICLFGGPGSSKSTTAAYLFAKFKRSNCNIELVSEYIKEWTYIDRKPTSYDQCYVQMSQLHREDQVIKAGFDHLITDSPLFLGNFYSIYYNGPCKDELLNIAKSFDRDFPSINIFLDRGDKPYNKVGRFQTYEEALEIDRQMKEFLKKTCKIKFITFKTNEYKNIYQYVKEKLK